MSDFSESRVSMRGWWSQLFYAWKGLKLDSVPDQLFGGAFGDWFVRDKRWADSLRKHRAFKKVPRNHCLTRRGLFESKREFQQVQCLVQQANRQSIWELQCAE